jgi:hypothetical protein
MSKRQKNHLVIHEGISLENAYYKEILFWKAIYGGLKSYLPKLNEFRGTGGTDSSKYCFSVWLRHLRLINEHTNLKKRDYFLELGPGDSLGATFAAFLSGFKQCSAVEVVDHLQYSSMLEMAQLLIQSYEDQIQIPDNVDFPNLAPTVNDYSFKEDEYIQSGFLERRAELLRWCENFLENRKSAPIEYKVASWMNQSRMFSDVDLILAQSVFQYLDTDVALNTIRSWLKTGGIVSAQIDYSSHGLTKDYNGHWAIPNFAWNLIKGRRPFFINRMTHSETIDKIKNCGFKIVYCQPELRRSVLTRDSLLLKGTKYESLPASDFAISHCHFILEKV